MKTCLGEENKSSFVWLSRFTKINDDMESFFFQDVIFSCGNPYLSMKNSHITCSHEIFSMADPFFMVSLALCQY
jgi:hypothetical protein